MTNKHTPTPWEAQWRTRETQLREKGWHIFNPETIDSEGLIAELPDHAGTNLEEYARTKANAHLIAAAPELLAVVQWLINEREEGTDKGLLPDGLINTANIAIKKAKGE